MTTGDRVRAMVWVGTGELEPRLFAMPDLQPGSLLLHVEATGLCGTDQHLLATDPPYPTVLGHEIAGRIEAFGPGAPKEDSAGKPVSEGDLVALFPWIPCGSCWACHRFGPAAATCVRAFVYGVPFELTGVEGSPAFDSRADRFPGLVGGFGEYLYMHPGTYFWRMPDGVPPDVASLLDPLAVAVRAVAMARTSTAVWEEVLTADSCVVVQGAGSIGLLTAIVLREAGVEHIILTGSRESRLGLADRNKLADQIIDIAETDADERVRQVKRATAGRGADLVIDCANRPSALGEAIQMVRRLGTVIEVGNMVNSGERISIDPASDVCAKNIRLLGMSANPPRSYAEAVALLSRHQRIPFEGLITHRFPQRAAAEAIGELKSSGAVKVVLTEA